MSSFFPAKTPHADALREGLLQVSTALDGFKAAGFDVPHAAIQGAATLNLGLMLVRGLELEAAGVPMPSTPAALLSMAAQQLPQ